MIAILVEGPSPQGPLRWLPWRRGKIETRRRAPLPDGQELLLLRVPPQVAATARGWRRVDSRLRRNRVSAVLCSEVLRQHSAAVSGEVLQRYRTASPADYAQLFVLPMLRQAAALCIKPPQKRSLCIVDSAAEHLTLELLLAAAPLAGSLSIITRRADLAEPLLEQLFEQTGLPAQCLQKDRAEADLVLLLGEGIPSVRAGLVLNLSVHRPQVLEGRLLHSLTLRLPAALKAALPPELTAAEQTCLAWLLLDRQAFCTLPLEQLL